VKTDVTRERIVGFTRAACTSLIEQVRRGMPPRGHMSGEELTECAGAALEGYAEDLLNELLVAEDETWVKLQFHEGLDRAGAALRVALSESLFRHAVAQVLQRKMFEAEGMLRRALKARALGHSHAAQAVPASS
jgi:hypothetical protein